jgi:hypothetical protein
MADRDDIYCKDVPTIPSAIKRKDYLSRVQQNNGNGAGKTLPIPINGMGRKEHQAWKVDPDCLIYNTLNGRLNAYNENFDADGATFVSKCDTAEKQQWAHEKLEKEMNYESLLDIIEIDNALHIPIVVTSDGVVIEGNRRLRIFRELRAKNTTHFQHHRIPAVILEDSLSDQQLGEIERYFSTRVDGKADWTNESKALECLQLYRSNTDETVVEQHAANQHIKYSQFMNYVRIAEVMLAYCKFCGEPNNTNLATDLKQWQSFSDINDRLQKLKRYCEDNSMNFDLYREEFLTLVFNMLGQQIADKSGRVHDLWRYGVSDAKNIIAFIDHYAGRSAPATIVSISSDPSLLDDDEEIETPYVFTPTPVAPLSEDEKKERIKKWYTDGAGEKAAQKPAYIRTLATRLDNHSAELLESINKLGGFAGHEIEVVQKCIDTIERLEKIVAKSKMGMITP